MNTIISNFFLKQNLITNKTFLINFKNIFNNYKYCLKMCEKDSMDKEFSTNFFITCNEIKPKSYFGFLNEDKENLEIYDDNFDLDDDFNDNWDDDFNDNWDDDFNDEKINPNQNHNNDDNNNDYNENHDDQNKKDIPALEQFGTNITELAFNGKFSECFGREEELKQMMEILVRRQKNNPVLIGEAGVGKTAIIELFATRIVKNLVPFILEGRTIISIDLVSIVAGAQYRGEFELRFQKLLNEVLEQPNIIIFIDEIHNITGAGAAEGSLDAANILKPVLARSGFQCIGATTIKEYKKIENDPTLNRRFQPIHVKEPSIDETIDILYGIRPSLEGFHNINISNSALKIAAELSHRYIYDRFLPDKAIDLLDRAAAKIVIEMTSSNEKSIIISIVNSILRKISILRSDAFRKGDITSEFVFQEIENSYKNFLLTWLEFPDSINNFKNINMSPISNELFKTMHLTIMKRADDLLFTSNKSYQILEKIHVKTNLSIEKNNFIYFNFINKNIKNYLNLSFYRISLFLFKNWIQNKNLNLNTLIHKFNFYTYFYLNRNNKSNFISDDSEIKSFEINNSLNNLEQKRISIFKEYLTNLKPIIRRGLIESFNNSDSNLNLNLKEIELIYSLLGYFNKNKEILDFEEINKIQKNKYSAVLKRELNQNDIRSVLSDLTGIPLNVVSSSESQKLLNLENILHERVIGQEDAISVIAKAIRRSRMGIQNPNRPIASFLFCGPTGVGKTEVTKTLAENLFGSEKDLIRFDMSEFMEKFTISRLVGSPPGYIGYDDGGQLTDAVRSKPYSVVLFDEIEKAHPDILNILLQILDDGRLTDSKRRLVHFDNTVIILTSNAASAEIQNFIKNNNLNQNNFSEPQLKNLNTKKIIYKDKYAGVLEFLKSPIQETFLIDIKKKIKDELLFSLKNQNLPILFTSNNNIEKFDTTDDNNTILIDKNNNKKELKEIVLNKLSTLFLPEFLNRLDDIIIFEPLKQEELLKICNIMIKQLQNRLKTKNIFLTVDENVKLKLSKKGYNPLFGARPLRRLITKYIEDLISEQLLISSTHINKTSREFKIVLDINDEILLKEI